MRNATDVDGKVLVVCWQASAGMVSTASWLHLGQVIVD